MTDAVYVEGSSGSVTVHDVAIWDAREGTGNVVLVLVL